MKKYPLVRHIFSVCFELQIMRLLWKLTCLGWFWIFTFDFDAVAMSEKLQRKVAKRMALLFQFNKVICEGEVALENSDKLLTNKIFNPIPGREVSK